MCIFTCDTYEHNDGDHASLLHILDVILHIVNLGAALMQCLGTIRQLIRIIHYDTLQIPSTGINPPSADQAIENERAGFTYLAYEILIKVHRTLPRRNIRPRTLDRSGRSGLKIRANIT